MKRERVLSRGMSPDGADPEVPWLQPYPDGLLEPHRAAPSLKRKLFGEKVSSLRSWWRLRFYRRSARPEITTFDLERVREWFGLPAELS